MKVLREEDGGRVRVDAVDVQVNCLGGECLRGQASDQHAYWHLPMAATTSEHSLGG